MCHRYKICLHSRTDIALGAVVQQVVDRPQDAADLWDAGRFPGASAWMPGCSFHVRPVLWVAGRTPVAVEGRPVQEDCRLSELWKWALEATGRDHFDDCLDHLFAR